MELKDLPYVVEPMQVSDIPEVMRIEYRSFSTPWSASAYAYELRMNQRAHYFVVRSREPIPEPSQQGGWRDSVRRLFFGRRAGRRVLGYGGFWKVADEAHISTIAVHPRMRRRGLGELLMVRMIEEAIGLGAEFVTLEVRVSNIGAQRLYEKYGFERVGRRKEYYSDNREDAWIMTTPDIRTPEYRALLERNKRALREKLLRLTSSSTSPLQREAGDSNPGDLID